MINTIRLSSKIILFIILFVFNNACKKDKLNKPFPYVKLETLPVLYIDGNKDRLSGRVLDTQDEKVAYVGFCYSFEPNPDILDNQVLFNGKTGKFSTDITGLKTNDTIYVMAFAANEYGYSKGNIVQYIKIKPAPPVVPCSLKNNTIINNGLEVNASIYSGANYSTFGKFGIVGENFSSGTSVTVEFNKLLENGIYPVNSNLFTQSDKYSKVKIGTGLGTSIDNGGNVYVVENTDGSFAVTFCDLTYRVGSFTATLKGKFIVK